MNKQELLTKENQEVFENAKPLAKNFKRWVKNLFEQNGKEQLPEKLHERVLQCFDGMETCFYAKDLNDALNTVEMFFSKNNKPVLDLDRNGIYELPYPKGVNPDMYFEICMRVLEVTAKGMGKSEILLNFIFGNDAKKSEKDHDNKMISKSGEEKIIESKNKNATYKGNKSASHRAIDNALRKHYQEISGEQFRCDDPLRFHAYLDMVYPNMDPLVKHDLVKFWKDSKDDPNKEWFRRVFLTSKILEEYKKIDKHDVIIASTQDKKKRKMRFAVIADTSDLEFLITNFNCRPQLKRGGGTQAVGDGYCDMELILS